MVRVALGDQARLDAASAPTKYVPAVRLDPEPPKREAIPVLLINEAATELGISTDELERMMEAGKVRTLMAGWAVVVAGSEVERIRSQL